MSDRGLPAADRIELVERLFELWNSGSRELREIEALCDPGVEIVSPLSMLAGEPFRGYAGVLRWAEELDGQFEQWRICSGALHRVGDRVLAINTIVARGRGSGVELDFAGVAVLDFAVDGRLLRLRIYAALEEALSALAVSAQDLDLAEPGGQ